MDSEPGYLENFFRILGIKNRLGQSFSTVCTAYFLEGVNDVRPG